MLYPIEETDAYADMQTNLDVMIAERAKAIDAEPSRVQVKPITSWAERPRGAHVMGFNGSHRERKPPKRFSRWGKR